jgi:putative ABC transport system permease protein
MKWEDRAMSIFRRISNLFSRSKLDREIQDELRSHLDMRTAENIAAGMTPEQAHRDALLRFGNPALMKERIVAEDAAVTLESLFADVRYALRQLVRNRGFAVISILTLALGMGATTGIFSILNAWIIQPLPLKDPQQLVIFWRAAAASPNEPAYYFSWRDYLYFRERSHAFQSLSASFERGYALTGNGEPESLHGGIASRTLFATLGVAAFRGRLFLADDDTGPPVAVISYALWTQRFHQSLAVLGETLTLNEKPFKVVGILPPGFSYRVLDQPHDIDVWTLIQAGDPQYKQDSVAAVAIIGRLKPSVTIAQAKSEITLLQTENDRHYPDIPKSTAYLSSLQQDNTREVRASLLVVGGAVGLLLLIACTNTASLIIGRNIQREKEFAIRAALGSSARRLLVQLLVENLVLYGISGALGLLIAFGSVRGFIAWNPFGALPAQPITVSLPVLAVAGLLTVLSGLIFGAYPASRAARLNVNQTLRSSSSGASAAAGKLRSRNIIVLTQIALSVILLIGASLLLTTFLHLNSQPLGFDPADTHVINLSLPHTRYASDTQLTQFADRLSERLRTLPGVDSVGMSYFLRLSDAGTDPFQIESRGDLTAEHLPQAVPVTVGPGYFRAMGIATVAGRDFADSDVQATRPVALINEEAVQRYFAGKNPIGEHLRIGDPKDPETQKNPWLEVVGVVASTKSTRYNQIAWEARPEVYTDYQQQQIHQYFANSDYTTMFFIVRTRPGVALGDAIIQKAIWSEDPNLPVGAVKSLGEMVARLQTQPRIRARLLTVFAGLTLLLAAIGIYGVMAQSVAQRYREIGIRMALGADRQSVLVLVLKQGITLTLAGVLVGTVLGLIAVRFMKSLLYGVTSTNPETYVGVAAVVSLVALVASVLPARRAASIDPVRSLRTE